MIYNRTKSPRKTLVRALCVSIGALVAIGQPGQAQDAAVPRTADEQARSWQDISRLPDFWQGTWQSIAPIADDFSVTPEYTPAALDFIKKYKPAEDSPFTNCKPVGLPFVQNIGGMPMKFFQSPGMIALYIETSGVTRFIHTDGRAHTEQPNPSYLGESIGHWEGDTLVVDTNSFVDDHHWIDRGIPATDALHIVERMRLIDAGKTLEIAYTLSDPKSWAGEWKMTKRFRRVDDQDITEASCLPDLNEHMPSTHSQVNVRQ